MIKQLPIPPGAKDDDRATEVIRVWVANNNLPLSLNLGMWQDAEDSKIDERDAWGVIFAQLTRHIANGLMQKYGWDYAQTRDRIRFSFHELLDNETGRVAGSFPSPEDNQGN